MAHFLFTQWDGGGSLPPELTVVRQLIEAGHTVTVLGDPVTEPEVRAVGVTDFRPWVDAPHHVTRDAEDDYIRDWEIAEPDRACSRNLMDTLMVEAGAAVRRRDAGGHRRRAARRGRRRASRCFGALMAAEARGIPCAALVPNVVSLPAEGMPPFGTGLPARRRDRSGGRATGR